MDGCLNASCASFASSLSRLHMVHRVHTWGVWEDFTVLACSPVGESVLVLSTLYAYYGLFTRRVAIGCLECTNPCRVGNPFVISDLSIGDGGFASTRLLGATVPFGGIQGDGQALSTTAATKRDGGDSIDLTSFCLGDSHCASKALRVDKPRRCRMCVSGRGRAPTGNRLGLALRPHHCRIMVGCLATPSRAGRVPGIAFGASDGTIIATAASPRGHCALDSIFSNAHVHSIDLSPGNGCLLATCRAACPNNSARSFRRIASQTAKRILVRDGGRRCD